MSSVLVFIETHGHVPNAGSLGLLAHARSLGATSAIVCGPSAADVAALLGRYGTDVAWYCDDPAVDPDIGIPQVDVIAGIITEHGYDTLLLENSVVAADIAAGLAARLDAGVNWDLKDIAEHDGRLVGTRLALADSVRLEVAWTSDIRIGVFRLGSGEPIEHQVSSDVRRATAALSPQASRIRVVEREASTAEDVAQLATADVVVAGGRGLRDRDATALIEDLADALGGTVAATLPLVDRGWYPHTRQVGQTGQKVRPRLYIACGVSGALSHKVGMERSMVIVAINSDETAPIFGICDAGIVGDLHDVVPELTRLIRERRDS